MSPRALATYIDLLPKNSISFFFKMNLNMFLGKLLTVILLFAASVRGDNWSTYPAVPKTASINGFADPIKSQLPSCASDCADLSTNNTPCPYWDTGCLCIMPQWAGQVAGCIAQSCSGSDVVSATSLAYSLCSKVGANLWMMPASVSTELSLAAGRSVDKTLSVITESGTTKTILQPTSESDTLGAARTSASLASPTSTSFTSQVQSTTGLSDGGTSLISTILVFFLLPVVAIAV